MGAKQTTLLGNDEIEEYCALTYFDKKDILRIFDAFLKIAPDQIRRNRLVRLPADLVIESIAELKFSPFKERLVQVFSSQKDGCFSFDDLVDLAAAFSEKTPPNVRAAFAFQIYDLNNDGVLTSGDLARLVDYVTGSAELQHAMLDEEDLQTVVDKVLDEAAIEGSGTINPMEFQLLIKKIPDFASTFKFYL